MTVCCVASNLHKMLSPPPNLILVLEKIEIHQSIFLIAVFYLKNETLQLNCLLFPYQYRSHVPWVQWFSDRAGEKSMWGHRAERSISKSYLGWIVKQFGIETSVHSETTHRMVDLPVLFHLWCSNFFKKGLPISRERNLWKCECEPF